MKDMTTEKLKQIIINKLIENKLYYYVDIDEYEPACKDDDIIEDFVSAIKEIFVWSLSD